MAFPSLLVIGGLEITDDGRTISTDQDKRVVDIELANGNIKRYKKAYKRKCSLSWTWMPGNSNVCSDKKGGRDALFYIVSNADPVICQLRYSDTDIITMTAFVEGYTEECLRRDFVTGTSYWNIKMSLKEQ